MVNDVIRRPHPLYITVVIHQTFHSAGDKRTSRLYQGGCIFSAGHRPSDIVIDMDLHHWTTWLTMDLQWGTVWVFFLLRTCQTLVLLVSYFKVTIFMWISRSTMFVFNIFKEWDMCINVFELIYFFQYSLQVFKYGWQFIQYHSL